MQIGMTTAKATNCAGCGGVLPTGCGTVHFYVGHTEYHGRDCYDMTRPQEDVRRERQYDVDAAERHLEWTRQRLARMSST